MQAFDHLQELWQKHQVDVKVSADEMLQQAKKEVNGIKFKSIANIIGMLISFITFASLWLFFDFQSWTTHLGVSLILIAIAASTAILYRDYRLISNTDFTQDPKSFLSNLKTYQLNRFSLYHKLYWFYTIVISLGVLFYFIEITKTLNIVQAVVAILVTVIWIVFCSTMVRRTVIKRERERIELLIEKFERITAQFNHTE